MLCWFRPNAAQRHTAQRAPAPVRYLRVGSANTSANTDADANTDEIPSHFVER